MKTVMDPDPAGQKSTDPTGSSSLDLSQVQSKVVLQGHCELEDLNASSMFENDRNAQYMPLLH